MLQIVWKHKHKSENGACVKNILTPPSIRICPLFDKLKKRDIFYPPPSCMGQCHLPSNFSVAKATLHSQMLSVRPSVIKTPQQLEIIILHHSSFIINHPSSSFIILHCPSSSFLHFATFKLFSLFGRHP